jgi:hypothetical protein
MAPLLAFTRARERLPFHLKHHAIIGLFHPVSLLKAWCKGVDFLTEWRLYEPLQFMPPNRSIPEMR